MCPPSWTKLCQHSHTSPRPTKDAILREAETVLASHNLGSDAQPLFIPIKLSEKPMVSRYQGYVDNAASQPTETQEELRRMFALDAPAA